MAPDNGNGRVTNRDLFEYLETLRKELKEDIGCVDARIDTLVEKRSVLSERVTKTETEIANLSKRVNFWGAGNSLSVIVAGILGYFGIRN